jgi:hypothetical protein
MIQRFIAENHLTEDGNPDGGFVDMMTPAVEPDGSREAQWAALWIRWQKGPLVIDGVRQEPNGCFVETVIEAALQRMEFYQDTKFACAENQEIIDHLRKAIAWCQERTARREARQVEGTSTV